MSNIYFHFSRHKFYGMLGIIHSKEGKVMDRLKTLTEEEILQAVKEEDRKYGIFPVMSDTEFLLQFYDIAPPGVSICNTKQAASILNLRLDRVGVSQDKPYTEYSVRQKVFMGYKMNKPEDPSTTAALFPLNEVEQKQVFGSTVGSLLFFPIREVLTVKLEKYTARMNDEKEEKEPRKRGRPRIHPERSTVDFSKIRTLYDKMVEHHGKGEKEEVWHDLGELEEFIKFYS